MKYIFFMYYTLHESKEISLKDETHHAKFLFQILYF